MQELIDTSLYHRICLMKPYFLPLRRDDVPGHVIGTIITSVKEELGRIGFVDPMSLIDEDDDEWEEPDQDLIFEI